MTDFLKALGELQEQYFERWAQYSKYQDKMTAEQRKQMENDLLEVYREDSERLIKQIKAESKRLKKQDALADELANYEFDCKQDELAPGRKGFLWLKRNESADLIYREVSAAAREMFNQRTVTVERFEEALENSTRNECPDIEPASAQEQPEEPETSAPTDEEPTTKNKPQSSTETLENANGNGQTETQDSADGAISNSKKKKD